MSLDVRILGAGMVGLSTAVNLQRLIPRVKVTIMADAFGEDTLDPLSSGIFLPIPAFYEGFDRKLLYEWLTDSWAHHFNIVKSKDAATMGHRLLSGYYMWEKPGYGPLKEAMFNYNHLCAVGKLEANLSYKHVCTFATAQIDGVVYMRWLMKQFLENGGILVHETVDSLQQLCGKCDAVVNCVGRRGRELLQDPGLLPIKGHKLKVKAQWAKNFYMTEENIYAIPDPSDPKVLHVGCMWEEGGYTSVPDPDISRLLLNKVKSQIHHVMSCPVLETCATLKPHTIPPKVETEFLDCSGPLLPVVHAIGLGKEEMSLAWGLGIYLAHLVQDIQRTVKPYARAMWPFGRFV